MPVEVKDVLTVMIGFGSMLIALFTLVVTLITTFGRNKKK
jgi:hypothetical protein